MKLRNLSLLLFAAILALGLAQAQDRFMTNLNIYPTSANMEAGDRLVFTAVAVSHSGMMHTPLNLTWNSSGGTISNEGLFMAPNASGTYYITASYGGNVARATVTVRSLAPAITRIQVTPQSVNLRPGETCNFNAQAYNSMNQPVPCSFRWEASNGAYIDQRGVFRANFPGTFTVIARDMSGSVSGQATAVIGQVSQISRIEVGPAGSQLRPGETVQFQATAYDQFNRPVTCTVYWQAEGGTISGNGFYTAGYQPGNYRVSAQSGSVQGWTTLVIRRGGHPGPHPNPPSSARILVTNWDVGGGNFFEPRAKITLQVSGQNLQTVKLYSVARDGSMRELQARSCTDGDTVEFRTDYQRFNTTWLEVRLYNNFGQVVAQDRRSAD